MKSLLLSFIFIFACALSAQQQTVITGKLLGHDKKPMVMAHVHLIKAPSSQSFDRVQAGSDGSFKIATTETGLIVVEFTGVNHSAFDVPLLIEKPTKVGLSVTLATYSYVDDLKELKIMSDLTDFAFDKAQPMLKQSDGTFAIELETKGDKLAYQVFGAEKNSRSINGTQSDSYEFDGAGDYKSIVTPNGGKVRIVFDPKKAVRSNAEAEFTFSDPASTIAKIAGIQQELTKRNITWSAAATAHVKGGKDFKAFTYDWSADQASIVSRLKSEKDPLVKQALLLDYIDTRAKNATTGDPKIGARALKEIPPDSRLWMMPTLPLMKAAADLSGNQSAYEEYLRRFLDKHPDMPLKENLLMNQLMTAKMQGDEEQLKIYYDIAVKFFGDSPMGKTVKERFSPTINIAVGKAVPAFKVKALEDTTKFYTNGTFRGKIYLIDFWATWCGPCVGEMENLHKAYERFKSKNFEILSLSLDQKPEDVVRFREDKWKMPWLHTFVTNDTALTNAFEVVAIPRPLLVDGSGKIVAMEGDLRGPQLEVTLARFLGAPK